MPAKKPNKKYKMIGEAVTAVANAESQSLAPLQIIRTETVISRLPIHNLVKGGSVNIQITQRNENGKVSLHWEVSPSNKFGHPGQLAYKLDTIVINRIIDEIGRPVPRMIKIGTLNQLCNELGSQKNELKRSLQQNAATTISAKLQYKGKDGSEKKLEAIFARYSIVFTGETLPTGEKADEIYIIFNEPYLEVLNSAPVRPLSYDYLRELSPTCQRFYEIVSYRIYAALKYNHPKAKLLYSEYCTYSAQQRHDNFERVRVQMYRVHKPHLESGYIEKVEFQMTMDGEGKPDWVIFYIPGAKAKAEYDTFNSKQSRQPQMLQAAAEEDVPQTAPLFEADELIESTGEMNATQLVKHFHLLARHVSGYRPASRELEQAEMLLTTYGAPQAQFIVEFAVAQAAKTNFKVRQFGAIMQYLDEGAGYYRKRNPQLNQPTPMSAEEKQLNFWDSQETMEAKAEMKLSALPPAELFARQQAAREQIIAKLPSAREWSEEVMSQTVKAILLREFAE
jgi:hypothetical protein